MSVSTKTLSRLPKIKQGLREGLTYEQIGEQCNVTERTINRDMNKWVESGLFETWLKREYVDLYHYVKTANPTIAFKELGKVLSRMVTRKAEIKADIDIKAKEEVIFKLDPEERLLAESIARKYIKANRTKESSSIH